MSSLVLDASVVVKWFIPERHSEAARRLLGQPDEYVAPDLLFAEAANAVWKKVRRGELDGRAAAALVSDICRSAVEAVPSRALAADAYAIAAATGRTVYDGLYLALAARLKTRLVTADERLFNALRSHRVFGTVVRWVED